MWILLAPFLVVVFVAVSIVAILRKAKLLALGFLALAILTNFLTQSFSLNVFGCLSDEDRTENTIRVMAYNVWNGGDYLDAHKDVQADELITSIINENVDILVMCELEKKDNPLLLDSLKKIFSYNSHDLYGDEMQTHVFSKYAISNLDGLAYRYSDGDVCYSPTYLMDLETSRCKVKLVATHLASNKFTEFKDSVMDSALDKATGFYENLKDKYNVRKYESEGIKKILSSCDTPIIVAGDFNDIGGSYAVKTVMGDNLADAWWEGGFGYGHTFRGHNLFFRLDHILYSKEYFKLKGVKVPKDWKYSDHYPIVADLVFLNDER